MMTPVRPRILITRPEGQQSAFASACTALGFHTLLLPCIGIEPCHLQHDHLSAQLQQADQVLLTSTNAVQHAHAILPLPWSEKAVHAIGSATANALQNLGQVLATAPQPPFNSEAFLSQISTYPPGALLIIKGEGGRTLITESLRKKGWQILSADVYRRVQNQPAQSVIDAIYCNTPPDIISVTSNAILIALFELSVSHQSVLLDRTLVVNGTRCMTLARELGFSGRIHIAEPAGDQGQLQVLQQWFQHWQSNFKNTTKQ